MNTIVRDEIARIFGRLDHEALALMDASMPPNLHNDLARTAFAFARLARGEKPDDLLNSLESDGSVSDADVAYVRAFHSELERDFEKCVEILAPHLNAENAIQSGRLRLRMADALLRLGRYNEIEKSLGPLLTPPGANYTLEAFLIILEAMLISGAPKEKLVENAALLDSMLERGFTLTEPGNVVYYARLCEERKVDALVRPLLEKHASLLERYSPPSAEVVRFLVAAGDKHKVPAAVRAAGRGYIADPFAWDESDAERVTYMLASHEEHEAARLSILNSYSKSDIEKDVALWGPLTIESYHSGNWKEALSLMLDHRREIPTLPMAGHVAMARAVCEYHLGRFNEALAHIREQSEVFYKNAAGHEAAVECMILARSGREEEIPDTARRAMRARAGDHEFVEEYASTVLNECLIRNLPKGLLAWLNFLPEIVPPERLAMALAGIGFTSAQWSLTGVADRIAEKLESQGDSGNAAILEGEIATIRGDFETAERCFAKGIAAATKEETPYAVLRRARSRRFFGKAKEAREDLDTVLKFEGFQVRYAALALAATIPMPNGDAPKPTMEELAEIPKEIGRVAKSSEMAAAMHFDAQQVMWGDSGEATLRSAKTIAASEPGSVEVLRLLRWANSVSGSPDEVRAEAAALERDWIAVNLGTV